MANMNGKLRHAAALGILCIGAMAQNAAAPQAATAFPQTSTPIETIKARTQLVLLDVVATDRAGNPVTDLKREDFSVTERGKPQTLASFALVDVAKRAQQLKAMAPPKMPPGVYSNRPEAVSQEGELTVLLLDALNTPWADQAYSRRQMLQYLRKNHQPGRMAIFGLTTALIRLQDFTSDPDVLRRVLEKQKGSVSPLMADDDTAMIDAESSVAAFQEDSAAAQMDFRVQITLDAMRAISRELAGYPGRKKLIWVSGSFPVSLDPGENAGFQSQRFYSDEVASTTALLRDSQVSVYTIDAQGLVANTMYSAAQSGRTSGGRVLTGNQFGAESLRRSATVNAAQMAAKQIADDTGGMSFFNRNDLDVAMMKSMADGNIYYALSYSPEDKNWDGKYRKVDVKVNRPGIQLRYRKGYIAANPDTLPKQDAEAKRAEVGNALNTLLPATSVAFFASAQPGVPGNTAKPSETAKPGVAPGANPAPTNAGGTPPAAANANTQAADVRFLVEAHDIFFQATKENRQHCNVQFVAGVFVADKLVNAIDKQIECNVEPETYAKLLQQGMLFRMSVNVPEGKSRIRLLVRDNLTGKMGSLDVPYPPPPAKP